VQQIDYVAHLGHATKFDKDLRHALIMNSELQDQMLVTVEKLQELERAAREAKDNLASQKLVKKICIALTKSLVLIYHYAQSVKSF